jgi:PKD repeat protein/C1A family cysteine protease
MLITAALFFFLGLTGGSFAQNVPHDNDPHKTGLKELTPQELLMIEKTHPKVVKVKLNKLGLTRVNAYRHKKGLSLLPPEAAVSDRQDLQTVVDASQISANTVEATVNSGMSVLPDAVDNSTLKYFPPIRSQGGLGSCGTFSGVYYAMTYMIAQARDWDAKNGTDAYRLSPKWGYNMVNGGSDSGSWYYWNYDLGIKHGFATWQEFPYDGVDYRSWDVNPDHWRNAIYRRFDKYGYVGNTNTESGIDLVKQMLVNGYILNIPTYISSWQYRAIGNDLSTTADDAYVGKSICFWVNGSSGYHGMTVVGYNDNIWVDINGNGVVDALEKGAFRIANSWGTGWGEAGFCWMAYDALKNPSAVIGGPSTGRTIGWSPANAHWVTARPTYTPVLLGKFTLNHLKRNQLYITLGISDVAKNSPTTTWSPSWALSYAGGPYAFNGTTTAIDGGFVFDFTDIAGAASGTFRYYLGMRDSTTADIASLNSFTLIDVLNGGKDVSSLTVPQTADASQAYAQVDYDFNNGNSAPVAVVFANPTSGYVPLTVSLDGSASYDSDGTIASYNWDFGDGVAGTGVTVSHIYQGAGNYAASLTVRDNLGGANSKSVSIAVSPDPYTVVSPSNLTARVSSRTVTLNWFDNSSNESGFYIERALKSKGSLQFVRIGQTAANAATYQNTATSGGNYAWRVQAFSTDLGKVSSYSNTVQVRVK